MKKQLDKLLSTLDLLGLVYAKIVSKNQVYRFEQKSWPQACTKCPPKMLKKILPLLDIFYRVSLVQVLISAFF